MRKTCDLHRAHASARVGVVLLGVLLAACSGSTGSPGAAGAKGAPGAPATSGSALNVSTATSMIATITSVTLPSAPPIQPLVKFLLVNQAGQQLQGLKASNLGFAIAKLVPAGAVLKPVPPSKIAPPSVVSTQWQSYLSQTAIPAPGLVGRMPQPQATTEVGNGDLHRVIHRSEMICAFI